MRKVTITLKDMEYLEFLGISIAEHLTVEDKLKEIIRHYIIIEHNKKKMNKNRTLYEF